MPAVIPSQTVSSPATRTGSLAPSTSYIHLARNLPPRILLLKCRFGFGKNIDGRSGAAAHLSPPPAHADQQKAPVVKELRLLALKDVARKLQDPAHNEQSGGVHPQPMNKDGRHTQRYGDHDQRNAEGMAHPVHRMRMAARVLCDPLFVGASAQHVPHYSATLLRREQKDARRTG